MYCVYTSMCVCNVIKLTRPPISDGDCKDVDDFPYQTNRKKKKRFSKEKNGNVYCECEHMITHTFAQIRSYERIHNNNNNKTSRINENEHFCS